MILAIKLLIPFSVLVLFSFNALADSIYGDDDRYELTDSRVSEIAKFNIPSLIQSKFLTKIEDENVYKINFEAISSDTM